MSIGKYLTDAELLSLEGADLTDPLFKSVVEGVEDALRGYLNYDPSYEEIDSELIELRPDVRTEGFVIHPRSKIRVRKVPIWEWRSLQSVGSFDDDGKPAGLSTIPRSSYHVDKLRGIITFPSSGLVSLSPLMSADEWNLLFGGGSGSQHYLVASYTAGYDLETHRMPAAARMALLGIISRYWTQMRTGKWNLRSSSNPDGGSTDYMRVALTEEEQHLLRGIFKRMSY